MVNAQIILKPVSDMVLVAAISLIILTLRAMIQPSPFHATVSWNR